jgi:hypothetical protein
MFSVTPKHLCSLLDSYRPITTVFLQICAMTESLCVNNEMFFGCSNFVTDSLTACTVAHYPPVFHTC